MTKNTFINPHEYETLFHVVANQARDVDGARYEFLQKLSSKLASKGTTALDVNFGNESKLIEYTKEQVRHAESQSDQDLFLETIRGMRMAQEQII